MRSELTGYEVPRWAVAAEQPRGVLRVDDNNTLTPVVGCVRIAIQILRIL
jgi:hypothetical protein